MACSRRKILNQIQYVILGRDLAIFNLPWHLWERHIWRPQKRTSEKSPYTEYEVNYILPNNNNEFNQLRKRIGTYKAVTSRGISSGMVVRLRLVQSTNTSRRSVRHKHGPQLSPTPKQSLSSMMCRSETNTTNNFHNTAITQTGLANSVALSCLHGFLLPLDTNKCVKFPEWKRLRRQSKQMLYLGSGARDQMQKFVRENTHIVASIYSHLNKMKSMQLVLKILNFLSLYNLGFEVEMSQY